MTRPEDIPERVWAEATRMAREYHQWLNAGNSTGSLSEHAVLAMADTFARAILAAEKRVRKECEKFAEMEAARLNSITAISRNEDAIRLADGGIAAAENIAAAIRKVLEEQNG